MTIEYGKKPPKEDSLDAPQVEELLKNLEFHKAIQEITGRINGASGLEEVLVDIREEIRSLFHIYRLNIYLIDAQKREFFTLISDGNKIKEIRLPIDNTTFAGYVFQKKRILRINDAYNEREIRQISDSLKFDDTYDKSSSVMTGQVLVIPIMHEGIILGVMEIMNHKEADAIEEYKLIFLDEITVCLARVFLTHLDFLHIGSKDAQRFSKLIRDGLLTPRQMNQALRESLAKKEHLETILTQSYNISAEQIGQALEDHFEYPFIPYSDAIYIPPQMLAGIERTNMEKMLWLPLRVVDGIIQILISDPADRLKKLEIEKILGTKALNFNVGTAPDILKLIDDFYPRGQKPSTSVHTRKPAAETKAATGGKQQPVRDILHSTFIFTESPEIPLSSGSVDQSSTLPPEAAMSPPWPDHSHHAAQAPVEKPKSFTIVTRPADDKKQVNMPQPENAEAENQASALSDNLLREALSRHASDIHFEPDPLKGNIFSRIRVDNQFFPLRALSLDEYESLTNDIKRRANQEKTGNAGIESVRFTFQPAAEEQIQVTATFIPTIAGVQDTVIHLSSKAKLIPLDLLSLSETLYAELLNLLFQPRGVIFIVGPTGAGITTTLHACLESINTPDKKIWTAEESLEIVQEGLRQVEIDPQKGFDFHHVLRAFLNADPDVIMVNPIRDLKTATLCMEASLRGRMVLASFPAETITGAMEKCFDLGLPHLLFADAMLAIVEQRLMKTLCLKCRQKYRPSREEYDEIADIFGREAFEKLNFPYSDSFRLYHPVGCDECGQTGYRGKTCVAEIFTFTPQIKRMLRRKENIGSIYQTALDEGMNTLIREALAKVLAGHTDYRHARLSCLQQSY